MALKPPCNNQKFNELLMKRLALLCSVFFICVGTSCKSNNEIYQEVIEKLLGHYNIHALIYVTGSNELTKGYEGTGTLEIMPLNENRISVIGSTTVEGKNYTYTTYASVTKEGVIEFDPVENFEEPRILKALGYYRPHFNITPRTSTLKLSNNSYLNGTITFTAVNLDQELWYSGRVVVSGYKVY